MEAKNVKNIIVVDDDRSIRVVISTALTRAGYNVKSSGTDAGMWRIVESDFAVPCKDSIALPCWPTAACPNEPISFALYSAAVVAFKVSGK